MKIILFVAAVAAVIILPPYIRCLVRRIVMYAKLRSVCRRKGQRLCGARPLWILGGKGGIKNDFCIETETEIISVKLFAVLYRSSKLVFTDIGSYYIDYRFAMMSNVGSAVVLPFRGAEKRLKRYVYAADSRCDSRCDSRLRALKPILLVHPVCHEIYMKKRGVESLVSVGDRINDTPLYTLSTLIAYLENS